MKSKKPGINSSPKKLEILNLGARGMWLLVNGKEYFLDYSRYPWFQNATFAQLTQVEVTGIGSGLYWPELDIDVELDALENPERYPLIAKVEKRLSARKPKSRSVSRRSKQTA